MQISKSLLTVCATAVCAGIISVHAQDNPAQAAARAALMDTMNNQSAPAEQPKNAPVLVDSSGVVTQPPAPPAQTNQIVIPPPAPAVVAPVAPTPAVTSSSSDNEAQARAREALLQQMAQQPPETPAAPTPAPVMAVTPAPAVVVTPAPAEPAPAKPVTPEVKPVAPSPVASPANTSTANYPGKEMGFAPIVAPPLPISMTKEQQLDALLAQYKADQITPEEYQKRRAAILAEP